MGLFDQFPYTNFHELNLDWILQALKELEHTIEQFVSINALKYADPIQWNITKQYEKNTIVIDPLTGTAYISVQPVPNGVSLTNEDYWTVVFDLGAFVTRAAKNFTLNWESQWTQTATFPSNIGAWLVWNDTLYKVISNIVAGDQYVIDSNIKRFTMEEYLGHIEDLTTTDKSNLVAAINEVLLTVHNISGDLDDLTTTDKDNLVAAINEVLLTLNNTTGDLDDLNTTDKTNLVAAINEVNTTGGGALALIGDLDDLTTTDKDNLVKAINEVDLNVDNLSTLFNNLDLKSVKDYGAMGDGTTDDTQAFQDAVNDLPYGSVLLIPRGNYKLDNVVTIPAGRRITFVGENGNANGSNIIYSTNGAFHNMAEGSSFYNLCFKTQTTHPTSGTAIRVENCYRMTIDNCNFLDGFYGIDVRQGSEINIYRCSFMNFTPEADGLAYCIRLGKDGYTAPVQIRDCLFRCLQNAECHGCITCDYVDGVVIQGCTINSCGFGILVEPSGSHIAAYVFIDNCVMDSNLFHSIYFLAAGSSRVMRCHVTNSWLGEAGWSDIAITASAATAHIEDIKCMGNNHAASDYGISLTANQDNVYDVIISNEVFQLITNTAIQITSGKHIKVCNNIITQCGRAFTTDNYSISEYYNNTEDNNTNPNSVGPRCRSGNNAGVAWRSYTPNISAGSGTIGAYTVNSAKFSQGLDKVFFQVKVTITSANGAANLLVEMPRACATDTMIPIKIGAKAGTAYCTGGYNTLVCYDATGDGTLNDNDVIVIEGSYELKTAFDYQ